MNKKHTTEYIQDKLILSTDPNSGYTQEDFNKEFDYLFRFNVTDNKKSHKQHISFINKSKNEDPKYQQEGDSGFDLRANLTEDIIISRGETVLIPTGIHIDLPKGFEAQVRSRSGLALKNNLFVLNSPGTIDYSYIDEIKVILTNLGKEDFIVTNEMRIAQVVICPVLSEQFINLVSVKEFNGDKKRGGFGSTGTK